MEEIWYEPRERVTQGRCSDLVAGPRATADGHLLVGHTNDLRPATEDQIVAIEKRGAGRPPIFQLGGIAVAVASAGTAPASRSPATSSRPTTSRSASAASHQVLEMMRARTLDEMVAMAAATRPRLQLQQRADERRRRRRQRRG